MPYKDPEKQRDFNREWARKKRLTNPESIRYRELRTKVLEKLGNKCIYCGCDIPEALEINHKNGGGSVDINPRKRNRSSRQFYLDILSGRRKTDDLELTCRVCNSVHYLVELKGLGEHWKVLYTL